MSDETKSLRQQFGNLVAAIHRDGGHRQGMIGHDEIETLVEDCVCLIGNERAKADEQAAEIERLKAEAELWKAKYFELAALKSAETAFRDALGVYAKLRDDEKGTRYLAEHMLKTFPPAPGPANLKKCETRRLG